MDKSEIIFWSACSIVIIIGVIGTIRMLFQIRHGLNKIDEENKNRPTTSLKIYIASSWKNQHAVEMLTDLLRKENHEVISWVENNFGENPNHGTKKFDFEYWVNSPQSDQSFYFDINGAMTADVVIYVGPSGKDAAAECGMAFAKGAPIIGLHAKGEDFGLMRKMMSAWCTRYTEVMDEVKILSYKKALAHMKK